MLSRFSYHTKVNTFFEKKQFIFGNEFEKNRVYRYAKVHLVNCLDSFLSQKHEHKSHRNT